jgi:hypothetical protein
MTLLLMVTVVALLLMVVVGALKRKGHAPQQRHPLPPQSAAA